MIQLSTDDIETCASEALEEAEAILDELDERLGIDGQSFISEDEIETLRAVIEVFRNMGDL